MSLALCSLLLVWSSEPAFVEVDGDVLRVASPPGGIVLVNDVDILLRTTLLQEMVASQANTIAGLTTNFNKILEQHSEQQAVQALTLKDQANLIAKLTSDADSHAAQLAEAIASVALLADAGKEQGSCGDYPAINNGDVQGHGTQFGAVRIIKCKEGYTLNVDSNVAICHSNKKWSDEKSASCEQSTSTTATSTTTTPLPVKVFNSWDVDFKSGKALSSDGTMDAAITVYEMRERQNPDAIAEEYRYSNSVHPEGFNKMEGYWYGQDGRGYHYGYYGKSKDVCKGCSTPTSNTQVYDNGAHPPADTTRSTVLKFAVPKNGDFTVDLFGGRRKSTACGGGVVDLRMYVGDKNDFEMVDFIDDVGFNSVLPSVGSSNSNPEHKLGSLKEGQAIYFAIHNNRHFGCDTTFVRWRITINA